ncbi:hypothetical protein A5892_06985 [Halotalea alkalilenta]|uniref:Uncharacterized protein n=1 Tax=Halotalea alkalilenta TaxID=376489 RepID=A0A172YDA5_9GAMM|nr:hypothetical protein A5892_06985 [Halotalea alkalilenta]
MPGDDYWNVEYGEDRFVVLESDVVGAFRPPDGNQVVVRAQGLRTRDGQSKKTQITILSGSSKKQDNREVVERDRRVAGLEEIAENLISLPWGVVNTADSLVIPIIREKTIFNIQVVWPVGVIEVGFQRQQFQCIYARSFPQMPEACSIVHAE